MLFAYNQMSGVNIPCRDCPDLLKLLIQIVIRSSRQLQLLSAKFYSPDIRTYLETGNRSDYLADKIISCNKISTECPTILQTNEEFINPVSPDDNTIACTDDLQKSITYKSWPIDCVCLTQVLSCAVKCLLGGSLTREITTVYQSPMEKYLFLELLESSDFAKLFDCIKKKSVDNYVNFLPEWINTLKNLYTSDIFDHPYLQQPIQQNSLNKPNWWNPATIDDQQRSLDWECVKVIFLISYPSPFPEYDSIKTLSVSTEMLKFLCDASKLISSSESKKILPKSEIDMIIQSKVKDTQHLPSVPKGLSFLTKSMYYLIADHYMKNNHFDRAVEYYLQDLCVSPQRVDTWASLGLIYSSELEQVLNLTNLKTERVSAEAVTRCLRCFNVALHLQPDTVTLLIERGCLAYQLHSYGARIVKKSEYRNFPDAHLNLCRKWRYRMLQLARSSYESVLNLCNIMKHQQTTTTTITQEITTNDTMNKNEHLNTRLENHLSDNSNNTNKLVQQSKEEEEAWLCHYMLAKCAEKDVQLMQQSGDTHSSVSSKSSSSSRSCLMHVLRLYHESLKALDLAGAKYPKKIIVYNKIPFRAVEAIEVYYRIHALSLKTLLKHGPPTTTNVTNQSSQSTYSIYPINLIELDQFLTMIDSSDFVTSAKKPCRRTRKRTANMAGLSNKHNQLQKSTNQLGSCDNHNKQMGTNETNIKESSADKLVQPLDIKLNPNTIPSQDEFIDLISPDPHIVVDEEESTNLLEPSSSRSSVNECVNKLGLWKKCIDRCRCALELVLQRLPLHYKAMYRLASLYLHAPHLKDPCKALDILLGPTDESQKHLASTHTNTLNDNNNVNTTNASTHLNIGGLFKDRKQNNFFYGVWRIPTADIDRSGNFAAHMYRSVCLTLSLLHDHGDWRRLVQIFHQLRKQPPEEKRGFLGEGDRVYLARRAFNLIQPTLLNWLTQLSLSLANKISEQISKDHTFVFSSDISCITSQGFLTNEILTQIYRLHCVSYSRNSSSSSCSSSTTTNTTSGVLDSTLNSLNSSLYSPTTNNNVSSTTANTTTNSGTSTLLDVNTTLAAEISGYASVLQLAYRLCPTVWDSRGPLVPLDWILQRCSELASSRSQIGLADSSSK
ncbi:Calcineurin-binding protein cabin-1, variant 3 [Schistosoma haematobium]|nr:Calcineurin-binding protein cabin-1, variant 3 [Schistosoma haematobium]KAH9587183.1 Calcineurin-binding protein cabin-1, variant 3 [Schistosoma haematobium]